LLLVPKGKVNAVDELALFDKNPLISVVIPTYNSGTYIAETLKSVFLQNYNNFEVIVSDDGSSDNTAEVVQNIFDQFSHKKTVFLANSHQGPGHARNKGVEVACSEWISFLDSDDHWFPEKLQTVSDCLYSNEEINLICHSEILQNESENRLLKYSELFDKNQSPFMSFYRCNALSTSAVTVKKKLLIKAGLFDTTLPSAQDYDLWLRVALHNEVKIKFIDKPLGFYVMRDGNISSNPEQRLRCLLRINQKYIGKLQQKSKWPLFEKLKYEGRAYFSTGIELLKKGKLKGAVCLFVGIVKYPLRFDLLYKLYGLVKKKLKVS
jgi:teichuronic acid biosynthesis glycosyltransferase TuaG